MFCLYFVNYVDLCNIHEDLVHTLQNMLHRTIAIVEVFSHHIRICQTYIFLESIPYSVIFERSIHKFCNVPI